MNKHGNNGIIIAITWQKYAAHMVMQNVTSASNLKVPCRMFQGQVVEGNDARGALCIQKPWPGMFRTVFGDHQRYLDTYYRPFPGNEGLVS